ncbi:hypothetical protein CQW23_00739 [Capsicum baccatum]|uniref:Uncharacterized protein n=1 Tax=Capsicum baccatum TaxID=33114 RepID=A0A2G2XLK6_CAPBA|nr:hypothetical protein CQW23_00739 [Capsicum baccatum]
MVEESTDFGSDKTIMRILEDGSMVRNRDKGQKKGGQWEMDDDIPKQPFIKEISDDDDNSEEEANDSDVVAIREAAAGSAVNTESGSWSNVGSIGFKSPVLNVADESECKASSSDSESEASSSESESKASSDEDNDDPNDKNYRIHKSSSSKKSAYRRCDFDNEESKDGDKSKDDDLSCPIEQDINEEGKKESNGWEIVPFLVVEGEKCYFSQYSRCIHTGATGLGQYGIYSKKLRSHSASSPTLSNVINSDSIVEQAIQVSLDDFQEAAPPSIVNTYPLVDFTLFYSVIQFASLYPSSTAGYLLQFKA